MCRSGRRKGLTLIELIIGMIVIGIIATSAGSLLRHGIQSYLYLPNAQATNQQALELLHAIIEGSVDANGQLIRGLRYAARQHNQDGSTEPALWLAEYTRIGYFLPFNRWITTDDLYVVIQLDTDELVKRRTFTADPGCSPPAPDATWETLPYYADDPAIVRILAASSQLFRYYDAGENSLGEPGCGNHTAIRRVDIALDAQTSTGNFDQGEAQLSLESSVAIRFP